MRKFLFLIVVSIFTVHGQSKDPVTVDFVDLNKYIGKWYEIAKIPNRFQKQCVKNTTAQYSFKENGDIEVVNSCVDKDGETDKATGTAKVVDKNSNAKLEVSFLRILGVHLFWGDYWIIGLDDEYSYAVIGTPNRKYGWILSRTPELSSDKLAEANKILERNGYNKNDFVDSPQRH
jgi:apolipoprotein D and lipocalin family protein